MQCSSDTGVANRLFAVLKKGVVMRILCAVDGSEWSQWGVQALEALANREPEDVTLLHVVDPSAIHAGRGKNPEAEKRALGAMEKAGTIILREAERSARVALGQAATGPRTRFHPVLAHGPLARTIARQAQRAKVDLILIGSRGISDIEGFLLGSISRQVASIAPCSVLVVLSCEPLKQYRCERVLSKAYLHGLLIVL